MSTDLPVDLVAQCKKLKTEIQQSLVEYARFPDGNVLSLMKQLALVCLILRDKEECLYYLMNCHGFDLRIRSLLRLEGLMKDGASNGLDLHRECLQFRGQYDTNGLDSMLGRLRVLPSEWRVIQVSVIFNPETRWLSEEYRYVTPRLYVSVFECGAKARKPLTVSIKRNQDTTTIWDHFLKSLHLNREKYKESNYLMQQRKRILSAREMEQTLNFMRKNMFGIWISLFIGNFVDGQLEFNLIEAVNKVLNELDLISVIDEMDQRMLYQIVKGFNYLSEEEFECGVNVLAKACPKDVCELLIKKLRSICVENSFLKHALRLPVILVLDEQLEALPWENLDVLVDHPVSRVSSIPHLQVLYEDYKDLICKGAVEFSLKSSDGFYVINPSMNLISSQKRLEPYMKKNFPHWKGIIGRKLTEDEIKEALSKQAIYLYCGHGSGGHLFSPHKVLKLNVKSVILLFGCSSNLWDNSKRLNTSRAYFISGSPCVVGMLWEVGDTDSDAITMKFLNLWLVQGEQREPELLRALTKGRGEARDIMNKTALVARGLPIRVLCSDC